MVSIEEFYKHSVKLGLLLLLGEGEGGMMRSWSMLLLRLEACKAVQ